MNTTLQKMGLKIFKKGSLLGIKDNSGNVILNPEYNDISDDVAYNGNIVVYDKNNNKKLLDIYSYLPDEELDENYKPTLRQKRIVEHFVKKTTKTMMNEAKLYLLDASDVKAGNKMVQDLSQVSGISMMTNDKTLKEFEYKISRLRMDIMEYIEENSDVKYTSSGNSKWKLIKK
jgi:hypothetical protein